ncbi:MAG: universal stress protein [Deltaproteobacteria bacterium]|nr:universal stress protein [Deltaproteobacteria bacterium]
MIKIDRILVPTDFSRASLAGIRYALSLAKDHGAGLFVFHAISPEIMRDRAWEDYPHIGSEWAARFKPGALDEVVRNKAMDLVRFLDEMVEPELRQGIRITPLVRLGEVVDEIIAAAKETQCDLIVMTSRERSWLGRMVTSSLTQQVVRSAPCPVLSIQPWAQIRTDRGERVSIQELQLAV